MKSKTKALVIAGVMRLRSVGRAVEQLTVAYEAWVCGDVFGFHASPHIRRGKQLAHNRLIGATKAIVNGYLLYFFSMCLS